MQVTFKPKGFLEENDQKKVWSSNSEKPSWFDATVDHSPALLDRPYRWTTKCFWRKADKLIAHIRFDPENQPKWETGLEWKTSVDVHYCTVTVATREIQEKQRLTSSVIDIQYVHRLTFDRTSERSLPLNVAATRFSGPNASSTGTNQLVLLSLVSCHRNSCPIMTSKTAIDRIDKFLTSTATLDNTRSSTLILRAWTFEDAYCTKTGWRQIRRKASKQILVLTTGDSKSGLNNRHKCFSFKRQRDRKIDMISMLICREL